jgi:hypothetical protein
MSPKRFLYPGQLPVFRFETEPKSKLNRTKLNVAERRAAARVSMSKLRRRKLKEFDYQAYKAAFAKRYVSMHVMC